MGIAAAIIGLIGAAVAVGGSIYGSEVASDDMASAQKEAKRLADIRRKDELAIKEANERITSQQLKLQNKQFTWQKSESKKDRAERSGIRAYQAKQNSYQDMTNLVNTNDSLRNSLFQRSQRGPQNVIGGKV
jgi:hypothetical protein